MSESGHYCTVCGSPTRKCVEVAALEAENNRLRELLAKPLSNTQIEVAAYELESGKLDYQVAAVVEESENNE